MPTDKPRNPSKFPAYFNEPFSKWKGKHILAIGDTQAECKLLARKFRCFLRSLNDYPLHPHHKVLGVCTVRTRVQKLVEEKWALYVIVNRKLNFWHCVEE